MTPAHHATISIIKFVLILHSGNNQTGGQSNASCGGTLSMVTGETKSFYCAPRLLGQFVYVRIPGKRKIISICEVEVYSTRQSINSVKGNYKLVLVFFFF